MKRLSSVIICAVMITACNTNIFFQEWNTPFGTPPFSKISEADYIPAVKEGIRQQKEAVEAIKACPDAPTFENTIAAYEKSGELLAKVVGVFYNISESDSSPSIQALEEEITALITPASDEIFMDPDFFARVKAVHDDMSSLDREQQMLVNKLYETFERNGVALAPEAQARFKEINASLAALQQKFGNNLLAENNAFKAATGVTVSAYPAYMTSCKDRDAREKAFRAYSSRGNNGNENDNNLLCLEILKLRTEQADLLGYPNAASFLLSNKMAGDPVAVDNFLKPIMDASMAKAREDVAAMQEIMDADIAAGLLPEGSKIEPWDWFYYAEKLRTLRFDLDESLTKPYFSADSVLKGVFAAAEKVYGIRVVPAPEVEVYNPVVKPFALYDGDNLLGIFYADYFSRESKRGGAWMNNFREQQEGVRPIIVNVCNFPPATDEVPSLLTVDEVQTAFHEFGHALHGFFSQCRYVDISGTSVKRDFVEMFSQFNENWAFQKEILSLYARDYRSGELIPSELVEKIKASLKFNQGFTTGELCAASILDLKWHMLSAEELASFTDAESIRAFEQKVCAEMGLIDEIIPRYRSTYFNHVFGGGYACGYYGYLWSEVLDLNAFERFEREGIFNQALAREFRCTFLEKGGSEEPMTLFRSFCGSEPDPGSILRSRGLI
ncbi:MAG: M3 family metallopeptidase [Bacteroidales bacterium]|nr:M3 family metallopeptidase [Bacteroidales bacterium]